MQTTQGLISRSLMQSLGEGDGTPPQYSCLENPMDGGAWSAAVHGVSKSWTRLSDFTFTFHFHALEKEMATHSSVLAWRIPGAGEPGGLLSMGLHRVGYDWSDLAAAMESLLTKSLLPCGWHIHRFWGLDVDIYQDLLFCLPQIYLDNYLFLPFTLKKLKHNLFIILY